MKNQYGTILGSKLVVAKNRGVYGQTFPLSPHYPSVSSNFCSCSNFNKRGQNAEKLFVRERLLGRLPIYLHIQQSQEIRLRWGLFFGGFGTVGVGLV